MNNCLPLVAFIVHGVVLEPCGLVGQITTVVFEALSSSPWLLNTASGA
jgi:hypothetical protein